VTSAPAETRFSKIFEALAASGVQAEPIVYAEEAADSVRTRLLGLDGVLVWVDPIVAGRERTQLDETLRYVAGRGVFVSAHPDVIQKMGTKEMLYRTREMPWGTDTHVYRRLEDLQEQLIARLRAGQARVLKQNRGSSGNGVWKIELVSDQSPVEDAVVRVQHAARGAIVEQITFGEFLDRCRTYLEAFAGAGRIIDQPYAERLGEGMIRCYQVQDRVAGFGHQMVTALMPPAPGEEGPPAPHPRLYFGPDKAEFQPLKMLLESGWITQMQSVLDVDTESLPVIWDADFLLGPKSDSGEDTYVLCEVNVSSVFPIPDDTIEPLAAAAIERARMAKRRRRA
jgi:hypothetical protein